MASAITAKLALDTLNALRMSIETDLELYPGNSQEELQTVLQTIDSTSNVLKSPVLANTKDC